MEYNYITPDIIDMKLLEDYMIYLKFKTQEEKIYNMKDNLKYKFYGKLRNVDYYKKAKMLRDTIEWPDGEDIAPENLYYNSIPISEFKGKIKEL